MIGITADTIVGIIPALKQERYNEPISTIAECDLKKLHSSLKTPFLRPKNRNKKTNFCTKAALLFALLIENHCFVNGNKRIAVASLITLAYVNGYELQLTEITLYALAMGVTLLSKYNLFNEAVFEVSEALKENLSDIPKDREYARLRREFYKFMSI